MRDIYIYIYIYIMLKGLIVFINHSKYSNEYSYIVCVFNV